MLIDNDDPKVISKRRRARRGVARGAFDRDLGAGLATARVARFAGAFHFCHSSLLLRKPVVMHIMFCFKRFCTIPLSTVTTLYMLKVWGFVMI